MAALATRYAMVLTSVMQLLLDAKEIRAQAVFGVRADAPVTKATADAFALPDDAALDPGRVDPIIIVSGLIKVPTTCLSRYCRQHQGG